MITENFNVNIVWLVFFLCMAVIFGMGEYRYLIDKLVYILLIRPYYMIKGNKKTKEERRQSRSM